MTDLTQAIAEVKVLTEDWGPWRESHLPTPQRPFATILNAVVSGELIPKTDAEMAVALIVEKAADAIDGANGHNDAAERRCKGAILALADTDALAELARLRSLCNK